MNVNDSFERTDVPLIRVANAETRNENRFQDKPYTVYKIVVSDGIRQWYVYRRYNEFYLLFETLKRDFPDIHLKLPGKKLFGNMRPVVIEERRIGLHEFVQQLLSNAALLKHESVVDFLRLAPNSKGGFLCPPPSADPDSLNNSSDESFSGNSLEQSSEFSRSCELRAGAGCDKAKVARNDSGYKSMGGVESDIHLGPSEHTHAKPCHFEFLKVIGKGSFGKVYLARHKGEDTLYAVKVLRKNHIKKKSEVEHIISERNVLSVTDRNPFLVGLHYSFQTSEKLYFVLDYVNGGELFFHLKNDRCFTESRARFYAAEIACAIGYLHSNGIIYRDLKPENILLDHEGHIMLTDFGLCKVGVKSNETTQTFCGTPEYLAPEVIMKQAYDKSVDWWCLGSVLYEMLLGLPPFYSRDHKQMYENILHKPIYFSRGISSSAKCFLSELLEKNPILRLGSNNDFDELKPHVFFASINWDDLMSRKVQPPYVPMLSDNMDTRNIDPEFTMEAVSESVGRTPGYSATVQGMDLFQGFSYVSPGALEL